MLAFTPFSPLRILLISGLLVQGGVAGAATTAAIPTRPPAKSQSQLAAIYGKLPLSFEANHGQADPSVKFLSRGSGYSIFLTRDGAVLAFGQSSRKPAACDSQRENNPQSNAHPAAKSILCPAKSTGVEDVVRMTLAGAASQGHTAQASGEEQLPGKINYFIGNDPTRWRTDLPTYAKVRYNHVYPGIDLVYYGNQRQLEYDFVIAPGANPTSIRFNFAGARHLRIAANGDLVLHGVHGEASFHKPVIYQEEDGGRKAIAGNFRMASRNTVSFSLGRYDHTRPLVIDPILAYSTYLGGSGSDEANGIAIDSSGNAYVVGTTISANFPVTSGVYQPKNHADPAVGASNVFVSKLNGAGTALVYSTYLGGSGAASGPLPAGDLGIAIALDVENNVYVTGQTKSLDFPVTAGAFQTVFGNTYNNGIGTWTGSIAFVTKLNAKGDGLAYSTFLGGSSFGPGANPSGGGASSIAVDASGNAYVAGSTNAPGFPVTAGAFQTHPPAAASGAGNAFVSKLNPDGSNLVYSTYLGGTGLGVVVHGVPYSYTTYYGDSANSITVDGLGNAYVAGQTYSADFPITSGAFQTVNRGFVNQKSNAFVTKLDPIGATEIYSTFLGGSGGDFANAIVIDSGGIAYIAGDTTSTDFPVTEGVLEGVNAINNLYDDAAGSTSFVTKLNAAGSGLEYSTYLGGELATAAGLAVDEAGSAYVVGSAVLGFFVQTPGTLPAGNLTHFSNAFVAKLNPSATALEYASLLGGFFNDGNNYDDRATGLVLDAAGNAYITGATSSVNFPTTSGAFQTVNKTGGNASNAFVSKVALAGQDTDYFPVTVSIGTSAVSLNQGQPVTLSVKVFGAAGSSTPTGQITISPWPATSDERAPFPATTLTLDETGTANWTSSTLAPGLYRLYATYAGDASHLASIPPYQTTEFRVIGPPAGLVNQSGSPACTYGACSNRPLSVEVTDSAGYALQGVTVGFSGAGLAFSLASAVTNTNGIATVSFSGPQAGSFLATASVTGLATPLSIPIHVSPAPLTVRANGSERYYGWPNPTLTARVFGLIGSDTVTVTAQTTATLASPPGTYPVTAVVSGPDAVNYTTTVVDSILIVGKAPLHVQARNAQSVYGHAPPPLIPYFEGFVNGDTAATAFTGAPVLTTTVTAATPVGVYKIGVQIGTLASANYFFCLYGNGEGSVYVGKVTLEAVPNNLTMTQGGPVPPLTYTVTGFVNGDTAASSLTGAPVLTTTATSSSPKGHYPIFLTRGTLVGENYYVQAGNGVMTILP